MGGSCTQPITPPKLCPQVGSWEQGWGCWVTPLRVCACVSPPYFHPSADPCPGSGQWGPQGAAGHGGGGSGGCGVLLHAGGDWKVHGILPHTGWGVLQGPCGPCGVQGLSPAQRGNWLRQLKPPPQGWRGGEPNPPPPPPSSPDVFLITKEGNFLHPHVYLGPLASLAAALGAGPAPAAPHAAAATALAPAAPTVTPVGDRDGTGLSWPRGSVGVLAAPPIHPGGVWQLPPSLSPGNGDP